jgi:hypothetical protein
MTPFIVWGTILSVLVLARIASRAYGRRVSARLAADLQDQREQAEWFRLMREEPK